MTSQSDKTTYSRRPKLWEDVAEEDWNRWHWQQQNRIRTLETLSKVIDLTDDEISAFNAASERFHVAITPHYSTLIGESPNDPVRLQAVPGLKELDIYDFELEDPLAEESHMPVPGLTHRYPDRVLLYTTHNCPVYCRHCTRKRKVADPCSATRNANLDAALHYLTQTPAVRDVILSGGDPLSLSDSRLDALLSKLREIPNIEVIRIGTRNPVTLPQRITPELCSIFAKHAPLYLHTHFNHPNELCVESCNALKNLVKSGCVLGNQMVLLKGINDNPDVVMRLNRGLLRCGCRPYYILQADMAQGITHFRTPISKGLEIMQHLRGRIGGMGIPNYVIDLPGGGGKIELLPNYEVSRRRGEFGEIITFRNSDGRLFDFHDIDDTYSPTQNRDDEI